MSTFTRASELVAALTAAGLRASVDPSAITPPAVLIAPPNRTYDLPCGFTATWRLVALAPGAGGADRSTWAALDALADGIADAVGPTTVELQSYTLNGQTFPAYLCTFSEAL